MRTYDGALALSAPVCAGACEVTTGDEADKPMCGLEFAFFVLFSTHCILLSISNRLLD